MRPFVTRRMKDTMPLMRMYDTIPAITPYAMLERYNSSAVISDG